ncbi:MAG: cellulase family glycosylhydrolase [Kiritimatiellaeota bacterium]|nr:cellulase family glycosylhydrolase [Kiritimatiellota bacterium]
MTTLRRHRWVPVALCAAWLLRLPAAAESVVPWLDMSRPRTPVHRPIAELAAWLNGRTCSRGLRSTIALSDIPGVGVVAVWRVVAEDGSANAGNYATLRTLLPSPGRNIPNKTVGVRVHLRVERPVSLSFSVFRDANPRDGFYRPTKNIGRSRPRTLPSGEHVLDLLWAQAGIGTDRRASVNAYGFVVHGTPVTIMLRRVELLFGTAADAAEFRRQREARLRSLHTAMLTALQARDMDLNALRARLAPGQFEPYIWQGVQLSAMREQIDNWSRLAPARADPKGLEVQRRALVARLERGNLTQAAINQLQARVDSYVDRTLASLAPNRRRWRAGKDGRFHRPDGRRFRMFGPYFQRLRYSHVSPEENSLMGWRPWDIRYIAGMGFNGIRADVTWRRLEPTRGSFDQEYLGLIKRILREAERYGLGVSLDFHWPFPDWFVAGPSGSGVKDDEHVPGSKQNAYHWPEPLVSAWRRLAAELADVPNVIAFEVPTNEPTIGITRRGILARPTLHRAWNDWLRETYRDRHSLARVWGASDRMDNGYGLTAAESWDDGTILPLGFQGDPGRDTAYAYNPRVWDHLRWVAWMQQDLSSRIMAAIRESVPDAVGMMQYTIGDRYDHSPVPIDYHAIQTLTGKHVMAATHYGVGNIYARKAATLSQLAYDSERQMPGMRDYVRKHVELGLGLCPFSFFFVGRGGRLLADCEGHLAPSVAYLPVMSDWIRTYWPAPKTDRRAAAVVVNTRLEATTGRLTGDLIDMLEALSCRVGVFEGLRLVEEPELLDGYDVVITAASYMDIELLDVLHKQFRGSVLLFGRLDRDAYARPSASGLAAALVRRGLFLRDASVAPFSVHQAGRIDLSGTWEWAYTGKERTIPSSPPKTLASAKWGERPVPGVWGEQGIPGSGRFRLGTAWYRRRATIPEAWRGKTIRLVMGAIDDEDAAFVNGRLVGSTTAATRHSYKTRRDYAVPAAAIRWGQANEILICNVNTFRDGGIRRGPVELVAGKRGATLHWLERTTDEPDMIAVTPAATCLRSRQLAESARVLARVGGSDTESPPALVRQGRWLWWVGDTPWSAGRSADQAALRRSLREWPEPTGR